jgi:hypothetical protein
LESKGISVVARLRDPQYEIIAQRVAAGMDVYAANEAAGYDPRARSFKANSRKRVNQPEVRERIGELMMRAAEIAEIDAGYVLYQLNALLAFNVADFLGAPLENGQRVLDVSRADREQLNRVAELGQDVLQRRGRKDGPQSVLRTRVKGYDKVAILGHMARIVGVEKDPMADALVGLGDKLSAALRRAKEAAQ